MDHLIGYHQHSVLCFCNTIKNYLYNVLIVNNKILQWGNNYEAFNFISRSRQNLHFKFA